MKFLVRGGARVGRIALATVLGFWVSSAPPCRADGGGPAAVGVCPVCHKSQAGHHGYRVPASGSLGYGKPGIYPGFQGFGLGYHPGYGYGGAALGVGADGGYPFYGGPGYPHPWPCLRRCGGITPFPYFGGPGYPTPDHPNYFGGVGPLAPDQPVVMVESDPRDPFYSEGYGCFTGMVPYPESTFAPFETIAAIAGSSSGVGSASAPNAPPNTAPAPGEMLDEHAAAGPLGFDAEPVVGPGRERGLKVTKIYPGSVVEKGGLRAGDVIHSINGHRTETPSHLTWIIANAAPDKLLKMSVRAGSDGELHTITAKLP